MPHVVFAHAITTYDNPAMDEYAVGEMKALKDYIQKHNLPASVEVQRPTLSNDYLVNIMGGRMLATLPGTGRACADMLKVQTNRQLKKRIQKKLPGEVVNVVGKRWDESISRASNMSLSGERPDMVVKVNNELLLTPIAHFTLDDIWQMIGMVRNARTSDKAAAYQSYSDFEAMTNIYREAMGGECMILAFAYGKAGSQKNCGSRFGCWSCTQVENDTSLENMVAESHPHFAPLVGIRHFILDHHWDTNFRRWLTREPDQHGELTIAPNTYSPNFCRHLLRCVITAQVEEEQRADAEGTSPAFELIDERRLLAVQALWSRNGMHEAWAALSDWHDIYNGKRYYPWKVDSPALREDFPVNFEGQRFPLTLATGGDAWQMSNPAAAMAGEADCLGSDRNDIMQRLNSKDVFDIDDEGAEMFVWVLGPDILKKARDANLEIALRQEQPEFFEAMKNKMPEMLNDIREKSAIPGRQYGTRPSDVIRVMLNVGCLSIREADRASWERMLTAADSLAWYQVSDIMDKPDALQNMAKIVKRYGGGLLPPHLDQERAVALRGELSNIIVNTKIVSSPTATNNLALDLMGP